MKLPLKEGVAESPACRENDEVIARRSELLAHRDHDLIEAVVARADNQRGGPLDWPRPQDRPKASPVASASG